MELAGVWHRQESSPSTASGGHASNLGGGQHLLVASVADTQAEGSAAIRRPAGTGRLTTGSVPWRGTFPEGDATCSGGGTVDSVHERGPRGRHHEADMMPRWVWSLPVAKKPGTSAYKVLTDNTGRPLDRSLADLGARQGHLLRRSLSPASSGHCGARLPGRLPTSTSELHLTSPPRRGQAP